MASNQGNKKLTREKALWVLGLPPEATSKEVLVAYKAKSRPLKRKLVAAQSVKLKDVFRADLRSLVLARNAALGQGTDVPEPLAVSWEPLLRKLTPVDPKALTRIEALAVLDLPPHASDKDIRRAFTTCYRVLTRGLGAATTRELLNALRDARMKMRAIRLQLLTAPEVLDSGAFAVPEDAMLTDAFLGMGLEDSGPVGATPAPADPAEPLVVGGGDSEDDEDVSEDLDLTLTEGFGSEAAERDAYEAVLAEVRADADATYGTGPREVADDPIDLSDLDPDFSGDPTPAATGPVGPDEGRKALGLDPGADEREITEAYRARLRPLRTRMLLEEDTQLQQQHLESIRRLRQHRDAALSDVAGEVSSEDGPHAEETADF